MNAKIESHFHTGATLRVWLILGLIAVALGCSGKHDHAPAAKAPAMNHGGHADHDTPPTEGHGSHGNDGSHVRKLVVEAEPLQPQAGSATKLALQIQNDDGTVIKAFDVLHEKLVHLIVVRDGLDEFAHLHPEVDAAGRITIEHTFPKSGRYRLFADHQPQGKPPGLAAGEFVVAGDDEPAATLAPNTSNEVEVGEIRAHFAIEPGDRESTVRFHLVDAAGQPISDLQPYLGAMGHLGIISADGREYVHAHPRSEAQTAPDGVVEFAAHFPKPGIYKAWGQFQRDGSVFTVPFVLEHKGGKPMSHAEGI